MARVSCLVRFLCVCMAKGVWDKALPPACVSACAEQFKRKQVVLSPVLGRVH